jgi:drug/metabolite transporter (DMT)-like permease
MTLQQLFQRIGENPNFILFYFLIIPIAAVIAGVLGKGEGHLSPWKYLYASLIFLVSIPGIFAVVLNAYLFLFQRGDIMQTDIYIQVLPIIVMVVTIFFIRRNVG